MSNCKKFSGLIAATLLAASLAGCGAGGSPDDQMARFLVAPDKFVLYNCAALAEKAAVDGAREKELTGLMIKAGLGAGGQIASSIAYRPEYLELHGEMNELRKAAAVKNCKPIPALETPEGLMSDNALR
jgi:hypothetical protein